MNTLAAPHTLDKWDIAVIQYCKRENKPTIEGIKKIWGIRNASNRIESSYLVEHFTDVIIKLNLFNRRGFYELIVNASPDKEWEFKHYITEKNESTLYYDRWLAAIMSKLALTEIIKLSGYKEITEVDDEFYKKVKTFDN